MNAVIETSLIAVLPRKRGGQPIKDGRDFKDISAAEQIERWERVRHNIRKLTPHQIEHHFRMGTWIAKTSCGTVGCVAGQCALDPWFNRRGFGVTWKAMEFAEGEDWTWTKNPRKFFGTYGYQEVFVNDNSIQWFNKRTGMYVDYTPKQQHRAALRNVNQYLKHLKAELL